MKSKYSKLYHVYKIMRYIILEIKYMREISLILRKQRAKSHNPKK